MTPKEKAQELVDKMYGVTDYQAKQSALIAVDEIRTALLFSGVLSGYWQEVYLELKKL